MALDCARCAMACSRGAVRLFCTAALMLVVFLSLFPLVSAGALTQLALAHDPCSTRAQAQRPEQHRKGKRGDAFVTPGAWQGGTFMRCSV